MGVGSTERRARSPIPQSLRDQAAASGLFDEPSLEEVRGSIALPEGGGRVAALPMQQIPGPPPLDRFEYYCGSQASVFFGEVHIEECAYVAYNHSAEKIPIHSYASRLYNTLAEGPVLVRGKFGINLKEAGYMYLIQAYLAEKRKSRPDAFDVGGELLDSRAATIERILALRGSSDRVDERNLHANGLSLNLDFFKSLDDTEFRSLAQDFEQIVWSRGGTGDIRDKLIAAAGKSRADEFPAFDIYLTFGDIDDPSAPSTVRRIMDAELIGHAMQVGIDGSPIMEHWEFIARDIV